MEEYRDNGTCLGRLLGVAGERVFVRRPAQDVETLDAPTVISAEPELSGFTLDLSLIWDPDS